MNAIPKFPPEQQLTIEEFLAFTATRPQGERWELIEGVPIMNPSPIQWHQVVAVNITTVLMNHKARTAATWLPMLGVGTRVPISPRSLPQPDVYVQQGPATDKSVTDDALVVFEVLSRSNRKSDQAWRKKVYASVPNCQHYVTVSLKRAEIVAFDRSDQWQARTIQGLDAAVGLPAIDIAMPLADIYRYTPLGQD
ncbi:MAG: Uma2 family endonuclease [Hyphomicrobiaceae bacterium]